MQIQLPDETTEDLLHVLDACSKKNLRVFAAMIRERNAENPILEKYRAQAKEQYAREGSIELDPNAPVSVSNDRGAYVQGWLWVDNEAARVSKEEYETVNE